MQITMLIVAEPRYVRVPAGLGTHCEMLKFVAVQNDDALEVVFGYTRSHFVLALWYALGRDMIAVAGHFTKPLNVRPPELQAIRPRMVAAGRVNATYRERQRVPSEDVVEDWQSETLGVITPEPLRIELAPILLAHVDEALAMDRRTNPRLPQYGPGDGIF